MITLAVSVSPLPSRPGAPAGGSASGAIFVLPGLDPAGRQADATTGTRLPALPPVATMLSAPAEIPTSLPAMTAAEALSLRVTPAGDDVPLRADAPVPAGRSAPVAAAVSVLATSPSAQSGAPDVLAPSIGRVTPSTDAAPPVGESPQAPLMARSDPPVSLVATPRAASTAMAPAAIGNDGPVSPSPAPPPAATVPEPAEASSRPAAPVASTVPLPATPSAGPPLPSTTTIAPPPADDPAATGRPTADAVSPEATMPADTVPPLVLPPRETLAPPSRAEIPMPSEAHASRGPTRRSGAAEAMPALPMPVASDKPAEPAEAPRPPSTEDPASAPAVGIVTPIIALAAPVPLVIAPPVAPADSPTVAPPTVAPASAIEMIADPKPIPVRSSAMTAVAGAASPNVPVPSPSQASTIVAPSPQTPGMTAPPMSAAAPASVATTPILPIPAPTALAGTILPAPVAAAAPAIAPIATTAAASPAPAPEPLARTSDPTRIATIQPVPLAPAAAPVLSTPAPAAIVFGAAIAAAREQDRRAAEGQAKSTAATTLDLAGGILGSGILAADRATTPVARQATSIDTTDARWPQAMIARIEVLRDTVDAADTRIRLIPDALGTIDVAVRREGDAVHVHFTAEQPQTRALLQDAQPRLADAAEQRGVRLGQTSVDGGAPSSQSCFAQNGFTQNGQGQPRQPAPDPRRPASAFSTPGPRASVDTVDDARIA